MEFLTSEIIFYVLMTLIFFICVILIWNVRLSLKIKRLTRGKNGSSLESSFREMNNDIKKLEKFKKELEKYLERVEKRLAKGICGVENVNFNAFSGAESGGKSFATALVNEKGDGIILSSLHSRERVNIFSKKITDSQSEVALTDEEKLALTKAQESCSL